MPETLYAYKGLVYKIETEELVITERYMEFRDSGEKIDLSQYGEISLEDFRHIVDTYLSTEPK